MSALSAALWVPAVALARPATEAACRGERPGGHLPGRGSREG